MTEKQYPNTEKYKLMETQLKNYGIYWEYQKQLATTMTHVGNYIYPVDIYGLRKRILEYRTKVKKKTTDLPLIDISPCVLHSHDICRPFYSHGVLVKEKRETIEFTTILSSAPILPFRHCFIYQCFQRTHCGIAIKDMEDGSFKGTLWLSPDQGNMLVQAEFTIKFTDGNWRLDLNMSRNKRPLGQPISNLGALFNYFFRIDFSIEQSNIIEGDVIGGEQVQMVYTQFLSNFIMALSTLGSYKSKRLYKSDVIYVYADGLADNTKYLKQYRNLQEIDGWLTYGHWKTIDGIGKTPKGTTIKGLDWVAPYDDKTRVEEISNGQVTTLVKNHAIQRAKERYNMDLTQDDLQTIANDVLAGKATKLSIRDKNGLLKRITTSVCGCYRMKYKNKWMDFVLSRGDEIKSYRVTTFLPKPTDTKINIIDCADYAKIKQDYLAEE